MFKAAEMQVCVSRLLMEAVRLRRIATFLICKLLRDDSGITCSLSILDFLTTEECSTRSCAPYIRRRRECSQSM